MSWFTGVLDYWSAVQPGRTAAALAAAVEPLEDRRLLSVSCAPPVYCQPRGCNDVPALALNGFNNCRPVCDEPTMVNRSGGVRNGLPKPDGCRPVDGCNGPISLRSNDCGPSNNLRNRNDNCRPRKDDCRPRKDNCRNDNFCDGGPIALSRSENCESSRSIRRNGNQGRDNCESKRSDCGREERCEQAPLFRNGQEGRNQGRSNCRPDPCDQSPSRNGDVFSSQRCERQPSCETQSRCESQTSRSGRNDCFSKQPCKPVYCAPPPCNAPLPV